VDDEPAVRELLCDALDAGGLRVTTAASGREAVRLARRKRPDLVIADLGLGDCTGLDVIDRLRADTADLPAMVITGRSDAAALTRASAHRAIELLTKPLDLDRLRTSVAAHLRHREQVRRLRERTRRLRVVARRINRDRRAARHALETTCANLAGAYRSLSEQLGRNRLALAYQQDLIAARTDDDVFRALFRTICRRSGPVFGVSMACDAQAQLRVVGRFGVPQPDPMPFCRALVEPLVEAVLAHPACLLLDAGERAEMFPEPIRRYLIGVSVLAVPLLPAEGEMIGLVTLYRKGEQPFTDDDVGLAEMIATPTALAIRRND
jgi:DNA-binding response OmpR family regulator